MTGNGPFGSVDPLGEALHFLRMSGAFYCRSELSVPWGLEIPAMDGCLSFHVVTEGRCWLDVAGEPPRLLQPGELALVPQGVQHHLRSAPDVPAPSILELEHEYETERYAVLRHGGGGDSSTLVCGAVRFDHPAARHLLDQLPPVLHVESTGTGQTEWIQGTLRLMAVEARQLRPGGEAVLTRLADVVVIQAIRTWMETDAVAGTGWLGALQDPQVGRALVLIHRDPARAWTVAELASELAMSRSAFAARFTELVGEPAMQYVTRWRMNIALDHLGRSDASISLVAKELGYQSEAAFSRAFKRVVGVPPGAARHRASELAADLLRHPVAS